MQPLKQRSTPASPIEAFGIELLRAARGSAPVPGAKQRVREGLLGRGLGRRVSKVRSSVLVIGIVCAAGTSLAFSGEFLARGYQELFEADSGTQKPVKSSPKSGARSRVLPRIVSPTRPRASAAAIVPGSASNPATSLASVGATAAAPADASSRKLSEVGAGASVRESSDARASARSLRNEVPREVAPVDDTHLVFDAMRALRQERQPARASRLLDEYLSRFPRGPLVEEALVLSIEAKTQTGDARAKELSARYLTRFPQGRFRVLAERAQARFSP
jgi:hypothetical protein